MDATQESPGRERPWSMLRASMSWARSLFLLALASVASGCRPGGQARSPAAAADQAVGESPDRERRPAGVGRSAGLASAEDERLSGGGGGTNDDPSDDTPGEGLLTG